MLTKLVNSLSQTHLLHLVRVLLDLFGVVDGQIVPTDGQVGSFMLVQIYHQLVILQLQVLSNKHNGSYCNHYDIQNNFKHTLEERHSGK